MDEYFAGETLFRDFNDGRMTVSRGEFLQKPVKKVLVRRDEEFDLILEFTSSGIRSTRATGFRPGTVRAATETIEFTDAFGSLGLAGPQALALSRTTGPPVTRSAVPGGVYR